MLRLKSGQPLFFCYNMSYDIVNGRKDYFDRNGHGICVETNEFKNLAEWQAKKSQKDKTIFILSQGNSRMKEKVRIISSFRRFNYVLLQEFKKWGILPRINAPGVPRTNFYDCIDTVENNDYLKKTFEKYFYLRRTDS